MRKLILAAVAGTAFIALAGCGEKTVESTSTTEAAVDATDTGSADAMDASSSATDTTTAAKM